MALCLAESLVEQLGFDPEDQLEPYLRWYYGWYYEGHQSSTGDCFDISSTTRQSLLRFKKSGQPYSGSPDPNAAGNGSLMSLAPVPIAFANNPEQDLIYSRLSSRTTHAAATTEDACCYMAGLIVGA